MKVEVRPGQLWEFTDRSGITRRARVVRISDTNGGARQVTLRRVGSGASMRSTLHRLEQQMEGAQLVEDCVGPEPRETAPEQKVPTRTEPAARRRVLHQPTMSADDRRAAMARARTLQERGLTLAQIARALSIVPAIVEDWLRDSATAAK